MLAYIFKRLLLMIPTLFGVLLMTFVVIQLLSDLMEFVLDPRLRVSQ